MNGLLTKQEKELLYGYINGTWAKKVLERDKQKIAEAKLKFPKLYEEWISVLERKNGEGLYQVREEMKRINMRVWQIRTKNPDKEISYGCSCRGYHSEHYMMPRILRRNVENHLRALMNGEVEKAH